MSRHSTLTPVCRTLWRYAGLPTVLAAGALFQMASADEPATLPLQPATVAPRAPADDAGNTAAMVATLQQQINAQQALLQALQQRLAAPPPAAGGVTAAPSTPVATGMAKPEPAPRVAGDAPVTVGGTVTGADVATRPQPLPVSSATSSHITPGSVQETGEEGAPPVRPASPVATVAEAPSVPAVAATPGSEPVTGKLPLTTDMQRQAYASGVSVWRDIENSMAAQRSLGIALDPQYVMEGVRDMYERSPLKLSPDAIDAIMTSLNARYADRIKEVRVSQEAEGKAYRVSFSKQKGAFSDAGAWYLIESKGTGQRLRTTDMAVLTVTGTLPDGTVFDASGQNGQNKTVKVGALMPSVAIGLQKVGVGGRLKVVVPPAKGYGDAGLPPTVPGGATLIFDIEVKGIESGGN